MSAAERTQLRSERYVTTGYRNVFHRAFLYGLGLSLDDMRKPFVGLAVAHSEALPGHALVRAVADNARRGLPLAGLTEREFTVPVTTGDGVDAVTSRELAADSAELVVRGHWYDGLVGVAAEPAPAFGLAQTIARLGIPGLVLVPAERGWTDRASAVTGASLAGLGLGGTSTIDGGPAADGLAGALASSIHNDDGVVSVHGRLLRGDGTVPGVELAEILPHLAALAHEHGVVDAAALAVPAAVEGERLRHVELVADGAVVGEALMAVGPAGASAEVVVSEGVLGLRVADEVHRLVEPAAVPAQQSGRLAVVSSGAAVLGSAPGAVVEVRVGGSAPGAAPRFPVPAIAGVGHPGPTDSPLNYDRF